MQRQMDSAEMGSGKKIGLSARDFEKAEEARQATKKQLTQSTANLHYSHKIYNVDDPDGKLEEQINKLARRYSRLDPQRDSARKHLLKEKLVAKCMKFFFVVGENAVVRDDGVVHEGEYAQVDEFFIDALIYALERYDSKDGLFTHLLRKKFRYVREDEANAASKYDKVFGGGAAPISLDSNARKDDDGMKMEEKVGVEDEALGVSRQESKECRLFSEALADRSEDMAGKSDDEVSENALLLKMMGLIADFMGKTGRAANETRKLYTKLFASELLTRMVKTASKGDLASYETKEKELFAVVELAFQDSYTIGVCRSLAALWDCDFIEGVPELRYRLANEKNRHTLQQNYGWHLPAFVFIRYLESLNRPASDALVSQQRAKFEELLSVLKAEEV